jgi:hypothetical protein
MATTDLLLHTTPDTTTDAIAAAISAALGDAQGVLAVRLATATGTVSIEYDHQATSPGRLQAALRAHGVPASPATGAPAGGCCGGCCS